MAKIERCHQRELALALGREPPTGECQCEFCRERRADEKVARNAYPLFQLGDRNAVCEERDMDNPRT